MHRVDTPSGLCHSAKHRHHRIGSAARWGVVHTVGELCDRSAWSKDLLNCNKQSIVCTRPPDHAEGAQTDQITLIHSADISYVTNLTSNGLNDILIAYSSHLLLFEFLLNVINLISLLLPAYFVSLIESRSRRRRRKSACEDRVAVLTAGQTITHGRAGNHLFLNKLQLAQWSLSLFEIWPKNKKRITGSSKQWTAHPPEPNLFQLLAELLTVNHQEKWRL